jgi:hypothetical protein
MMNELIGRSCGPFEAGDKYVVRKGDVEVEQITMHFNRQADVMRYIVEMGHKCTIRRSALLIALREGTT